MSNANDSDIKQATARAERQSEFPGGSVVAPMRADDHSSEDPAVATPVESRQGFLGRPVLAVLIGGLLLAGLAWVILHYAVR
ncbi:MAG: hypothetical protein J0J10_21745 [Bosea sp.]|jgi:hypothetical protein|uniref:hypothetical protein n=1 Tax=Bosea sp. (in: a-proteobacteria) TaxID=1871050 RepID=UPI001AD583FC|nr:hypothetical protein [Bosea sp. (in: a-proteobacteria)]MBN9471398.1 hypothetical protein [Bosea sp. (in: a-proteobacteria)]